MFEFPLHHEWPTRELRRWIIESRAGRKKNVQCTKLRTKLTQHIIHSSEMILTGVDGGKDTAPAHLKVVGHPILPGLRTRTFPVKWRGHHRHISNLKVLPQFQRNNIRIVDLT